MKTSASYTIATIYDGEQIFLLWGTSSSNTIVPSTFSEVEPDPQPNVFIWRKEGIGLSQASAKWGNPMCMTGASGATGAKGDKGDKGDTGTKGATGDIGPRGVEGTSITGVTEYYLATTASSGVTTGTSGWGTTIQPLTATKKYLWNYEKIHFSEGDDQPTIPVIIGVYGDKGVTGATGRAITSIQEKYLVSPNATGIARAGNTWHDTPPATTTTNKYLWNYEIINWSTGTTPTYVEPFVIGVHGATGPKGSTGEQGPQGLIGPQGNVGPVGQGIDSITEQYAISTSKTTPPAEGSSNWKDVAPTWSTGKYLWTRSKIVYKNPTDTKYTTPVCDNAWEAVNEINWEGRNLAHDTNTEEWRAYYTGTVSFWKDGDRQVIRIESSSPGTLTLCIGQKNGGVKLKQNTLYTLSFEVRGNFSRLGYNYMINSPGPNQSMSSVDVPSEEEFTKVSIKVKPIQVTYEANYSNIMIGHNAVEVLEGETKWIEVKNVKIELGNIATDWTPAPEDLEGVVDLSVKSSDVEYYLSTSSTDLNGGDDWLTTAPPWVDGKYMWSRTRVELNNGTVRYTPSESGTCIAGATGPAGNPGALGFNYADNKLYLDGFTSEGIFGNGHGYIYINGSRESVIAYNQLLINYGSGYVLYNATWNPTVQFAKILPTESNTVWKDYNTKSTTYEKINTFVIGKFNRESDSIMTEMDIINPVSVTNYEVTNFMGIMAESSKSGDWDSFAKWGKAMGVTQLFESLAVWKLFVDSLTANEGFIENLFAQNATIDSILKTSNYNEIEGVPTAGFQIDGPNSIVKMYEALFGSKCSFYGKLLHPLLQTRESVIGDPYIIPSKTHWSKQSLLDFLNSKSLPSNSIVSCIGTYNGDAITHVINSTQTKIRLITVEAVTEKTYTIPFKSSSVYLYTCSNQYRFAGEVAYIKRNGTIEVNSDDTVPITKTITPNKGDILLAKATRSGALIYANLGLPSSGTYVILSDGTIVKLDEYSNKQFSITYGGSTWDYSSHIDYVKGSSIVEMLSPISKGITLNVSTGTLISDGVTKSINSLFSETLSVTFNWDSVNKLKVLNTGYYNLSGSFVPEAITAAVITDTILPKVNADDEGNGKDIGTSVSEYRNIYAKTLTGNVNASGTLNKVYGAVFN